MLNLFAKFCLDESRFASNNDTFIRSRHVVNMVVISALFYFCMLVSDASTDLARDAIRGRGNVNPTDATVDFFYLTSLIICLIQGAVLCKFRSSVTHAQ